MGVKRMQQDLTTGNITGGLLQFALPMMLGNLLQQLYNVADTLIVGRYLGADALAAVGSSYTLMTFLTSVLLGLCMGSRRFLHSIWQARYGTAEAQRFPLLSPDCRRRPPIEYRGGLRAGGDHPPAPGSGRGDGADESVSGNHLLGDRRNVPL